jgi:hypothetical protein
MIKEKEENAIKWTHLGRSVRAEFWLVRPVATTGLLVVVAEVLPVRVLLGLLDTVTTGLIVGDTMVFVRVKSSGLLVVVALVKVTSIGLPVVLVLV